MKRVLIAAVITAFCLPAAAQDVTRKLTNVTGDVYLFQNNFHLSLVVPTSEGTVRVDPINAEAGAWLNEQLAAMGAKPVSHLIYSHSHLDHASGGAAHVDAVTIAHENAPDAIDGVVPARRVSGSETLSVGGKEFEMTFLGSGHGSDMLAVVVRPENVGFIVDVASPDRLPFRNFNGANVDDWVGQIEAAKALDFDIFAPGHGRIGVKADLDGALSYMADLKAGVLAGLKAGKSVAEIQTELTLGDYAGWQQYEAFRPLNIEGMATYLQASGQVN